MKSLRASILVLIVALAFVSCTTFKASNLSMSTGNPQYTVLGKFETTVTVTEFLGSPAGANFLNVTADASDSVVRAAILEQIQLKGGSAAVDVTITHKASFVNMLLSGITFGIYTPGTLVITGTVVK